jgi:hypothetical protein
MKCVKTQNGKIDRIGDKEAQQLVGTGAAVYIKKSEWRKTDSDWKKRSDARKTTDGLLKKKAPSI